MKKTTIAAAKKAAKKAVKTAAVKAAKKAAVKKTAAPAPAKKAVKKVAAKKVAKKAAAKKPAASKTAKKPASSAKTTIVANIDIGFGNTLFLRGDAPGLSWSEGVPMDCAEESSWSIAMAGITEPFEFKVLINDSFWSSGYNHTAEPGKTTTVLPVF